MEHREHHVSPRLEIDGVETEQVRCTKNSDGTLNCTVNPGRSVHREHSGTGFKEVVDKSSTGVSRHYGPNDDPHVVFMFEDNATCTAHGRLLVCE